MVVDDYCIVAAPYPKIGRATSFMCLVSPSPVLFKTHSLWGADHLRHLLHLLSQPPLSEETLRSPLREVMTNMQCAS